MFQALDVTLKWGNSANPNSEKHVSVNFTNTEINSRTKLHVTSFWNREAQHFFDVNPVSIPLCTNVVLSWQRSN